MKTSSNKFTLSLFIFSAILGAIAYGLTYLLPAKYFSPVLPMLFPFFLSATAIIFFYLSKSNEHKQTSFINRFMVATSVKLLVYFVILLAYVFTHKEDAVPFIISFFIMYVAYTAFEVVAMLRYSRRKQ